MSLNLRDCPADDPVHLCSWADQPSIYIPCDRLWTRPFWWADRLPKLPPNIHRAGDPKDVERVWGLYTFYDELVTCPECLRLMAENDVEPG